MKRALRIDPRDNTATALNDLEAGETVSLTSKSETVGKITANQAIPLGHKLAVKDIGKGEKVYKYGEVFGIASQPIRKGDHVHIHNVESALVPPPRR
jgi:altronate dehydratase small subunit